MYLYYGISPLNEVHDWANILNVRMNIRSYFVYFSNIMATPLFVWAELPYILYICGPITLNVSWVPVITKGIYNSIS
jgi:hypothetical protein